MKAPLIIFTFFIWCLISIASAQTGNHFSVGNGMIANWDEDSLDLNQFFKREASLHNLGEVSTINDYSGNIQLIAEAGRLWDANKTILVQRQDSFGYHPRSLLFPLTDSIYIHITKRYRFIGPRRSVDTSSFEFVYDKILRHNFKYEVIESEKVFFKGRFGGYEFFEDTLNGGWVVIKSNPSEFTSFYFSDTCLACKSAKSIVPNIYFSDTIAEATIPYTQFYKSPSNNYFVEKSIHQWKHNPLEWLKLSYFYSLMVYEVNKSNGSITFYDTGYYSIQDFSSSSPDSVSMGGWGQACFSSNDSFLYFFDLIRTPPDQHGSDHINFWQKKVDSNSTNPPTLIRQSWAGHSSTKPRIPGMMDMATKLMINRKLYVYGNDVWADGENLSLFMHEIPFPGQEYKGQFKLEQYVLPLPNGPLISGISQSNNKYNYIHIKPRYDYDCGATVYIDDLCDYAFPDAKTTYWVEEIAGSGDLKYKGQNPLLQFDRNGDYLLKVVFKSELGNYKEIHFDTLHIRIPPKPVANFEASDTVVCRYSATTFFNRSRTANIHPQKGEKWVWTFGDGTTFSTTNPMEAAQVQHTYTQTGTFSVSLFYSNGYCDSTLVRNQFIRVVDAPKPGFSVDNQHGCTPFEVHFTDTVQLHVQKKEYFFSDEGQWREISNPHFSHTFQSAGKWFAVQRLYGFTGCITQTDTQFFSVKPGFTPDDTLNIQLATYQDNEHILLEWPVFAHAEAYQLHKAGATVTTEQNAYTHSIAAPGLYEYRLQAIDSCGNPTRMSATERPVFLQGEVIGNNEAALQRFSPYLGQEDLNYRILREGVPLSSFAQPDADLRDENFKAAGGLQACYVVEAIASNNWLSRSNTLCLPYIPTVFVPNAFSPNGDGLNDVFAPSTFGISEYTLNIYNRWGELIHQGKAWNGHNALPGAYFYTLEATDNQGKRIFLKGSVSVVE